MNDVGVCRQYFQTEEDLYPVPTNCTRQLSPPFDLLSLIEQDIPNATSTLQFQNWQQLLNQSSPSFEISHQVVIRNRQRRAIPVDNISHMGVRKLVVLEAVRSRTGLNRNRAVWN